MRGFGVDNRYSSSIVKPLVMDRPCSLSPNFAGPAISNRNDILRSALSKLKHLDKTGLVIYDSADMHAHGGYCDVFVGRISKKHLDPVYSKIIVEDQLETESDIKIAIKRLRVHILNDQDFMKVNLTGSYTSHTSVLNYIFSLS